MLRFDHLVLPIWEPEKSLAFYRDILGLKLAGAHDGDDWGGYPWLMLLFALGDGREIVLVHFKGATRPPADTLAKDARHVAMAADDIAPWREKLLTAGVAYWEEDHGNQQSLYFEDPNGVVLEITSPPSAPGARENAAALRRAEKWIRSL